MKPHARYLIRIWILVFSVSLLPSFLFGQSAGTKNEIWVAVRSDQPSEASLVTTPRLYGNGTRNDPYDASGRKSLGGDKLVDIFNAFRHLQSQAGESKALVMRLYPGEYLATDICYMGDNWRIIGSGIGTTSVKASNTTYPGDFYIFAADNVSRAEISDMTLDCNYAGSQTGPNMYGGVYLQTKDSRLERLRIVNSGTRLTSPGSAIFINTLASTDLSSMVVQDCEINSTALSNSARNMIGIASYQQFPTGTGPLFAGTIRGVVIDGFSHDSGTGIQVSGTSGLAIEENFIRACNFGVRSTSGLNTNLVIRDNQFKRCGYGVLLGNTGTGSFWDNLVVERNLMELVKRKMNTAPATLPACGIEITGNARSVVLRDNRVTNGGDLTSSDYAVYSGASPSVQYGLLEGLAYEPLLQNLLGQGSFPIKRDNNTLAGVPMP